MSIIFDGTSNQWVIASPNVGGEANTNIFVGPSAPADPIVGSSGITPIDNVLYIYTGGNPPWETNSHLLSMGCKQVTG